MKMESPRKTAAKTASRMFRKIKGNCGGSIHVKHSVFTATVSTNST